MTTKTGTGPVTKAGQDLVAAYPANNIDASSVAFIRHQVRVILAIEAEARALRDAELRAAVEGRRETAMRARTYSRERGEDEVVARMTGDIRACNHILALLSDHARADTPSREGGEMEGGA